ATRVSDESAPEYTRLLNEITTPTFLPRPAQNSPYGMRAWKCSSTRVSPTGTCCKRPRGSRASEQSDEFAAFHCPMPPVLPREKDSTPQLRQETAALQDFDWAYDRPGELCAAVYRAGTLAQSGLTAKDTQSGIGQFFGIGSPYLASWMIVLATVAVMGPLRLGRQACSCVGQLTQWDGYSPLGLITCPRPWTGVAVAVGLWVASARVRSYWLTGTRPAPYETG